MSTHVLAVGGWHPSRLNDLLGHWSRRHRLKKADRDLLAVEALRQGVPAAGCRRRVSLRITLGPRQRGGDPDCYWKSTLDALVACRLLTGDDRRGVELGPVSFDRGPVKRTTITLEDIGDDTVTEILKLPPPAPAPENAPPPGPEPELIDVRALAVMLSVSPRTVWKMESDGRLPRSVKLGKVVRWRADEIRAWLKASCPPRAEPRPPRRRG